MGLISGLYHVVDQQCNQEQIKELLRTYKGINDQTKEEIHLTATKPLMVENLQRVVSLGIVPTEQVYRLIRECEENGEQHIYYYAPRTRAIGDRLRRGDEIATALFGEAWGEDYFPLFDRIAQGLRWSDFRVTNTGWTGKLYGHELLYRLKKRTKKVLSPTRYREVRDYETEEYNTVYVLRWSEQNLLEIRVDQAGAGGKGDVIQKRLTQMWEWLKPAIAETDVRPWSMQPAMSRLIAERKQHYSRYELGTVKVQDAHRGGIQFDPYSPTETVDDDEGRSAALDDLMARNAKGLRLVIVWKKQEPLFQKLGDLRTVVTGDAFNCLVVASRISPQVMGYVRDQLQSVSQ